MSNDAVSNDARPHPGSGHGAVVIALAAPLRDVTITRSGDRETLRQEDLQASYERGRLEGERALGEQLVKQRAEVMELQTGVLASLRGAVPQVTRECERALVSLALEAAQKLVCGLPVSAEMIEAAIKEACAAVEDSAEFTVQLHPDDLALLQRTNSPLLLPQGGGERIQFQSAAQITRGGCLVQTRFGVIDGRRETRVELLQKAFQP
jgi:flagellar assembly protein FliH